ncbi:MAG: hypothetical protein HY586_06775, partial [Candidatus Omnitrophica bacterium]|nr:hypothetical protein [Candidatus Omnitrophota bacterium]
NSEAANSQLYHCDHEDIRQLKLFIHISNVEESNGPLTVLNQEISELLRQKLRYRYYSKIPDERIHPLIPAHTEQSITGASGTLAFLDTSQVFHYGSRVAKEDRYVVVIQYVTPTHLSLNPFKPSTLTPLAPLGAKRFNALTRAALGVLDPI